MIYAVLFLLVIAVLYGIDTSCNNLMRKVKINDPKIMKKLEIPLYSIYAYYKWRKEMKNGN